MLINSTLYFVLMGVAGLALTILFYVLFKKKGWNTKAGITIGVILGFVVMGTMGFIMDGYVYIVDSKGNTKRLILMGKAEHKTAKGQTIKIAPNDRNLFVINEMNEDLVLERIIYGYGEPETENELIPANGTLKSKAYSIDYLINEVPPNQIETKKNGAVEKLYLRTLASYEKEYGSVSDDAEYDEADYEEYEEEVQ